MKDICQALYEYLSADAEIKNRVRGRIYPIVLPQNAPLPAIVYSPVLANYDSALQGDTGFVRQTVQFVSHDTTYKKTRELSRLIKKALQDYQGDMNGLLIQAVFVKSDYEYKETQRSNSIPKNICPASSLSFISMKNNRRN